MKAFELFQSLEDQDRDDHSPINDRPGQITLLDQLTSDGATLLDARLAKPAEEEDPFSPSVDHQAELSNYHHDGIKKFAELIYRHIIQTINKVKSAAYI